MELGHMSAVGDAREVRATCIRKTKIFNKTRIKLFLEHAPLALTYHCQHVQF